MSRYSGISLGHSVREEIRVLPALGLVALAAWFEAYAITNYRFPVSLVFLLLPAALAVFLLDMRWGLLVWVFGSALGNALVVYWPGIPAMRPVHIGLFLLVAAWFAKSYAQLPSSLGRFLNTPKNRCLLLLFGWITLSMVMAQLEGVTQRGWGYQFNAWLANLLPILVALVVPNCVDRRFFNAAICFIVALQTALELALLAAGVVSGVGLTEWKGFSTQFYMSTQFVSGSPLLLALVFFQRQGFLGKALLSTAIAVSLVVYFLMIAGGHRTSALDLAASIGWLVLFRKPRLASALLLLALPLAALSFSSASGWISGETERTLTPEGISYGAGSRIDLAEDAARVSRDHPLWGTGSDFYRLHSQLKLLYPGGDVKPAATPHNSWLQVAADHGIPALLMLVAFCYYAFQDVWRLWRSSPGALERTYALFFLCMLAGAIANSFVSSGQIVPLFTGVEGDETSTVGGPLLGFWLYYGLLLSLEKADEPTSGRRTPNVSAQ